MGYGEADNWGKRRPPKLQIRAWAEDVLRRCFGVPGEWNHPEEGRPTEGELLGLDLLGPGGGQWHFVLRAGELLRYDRGLPETCRAVVRLPAAKWIARLEQERLDNGDGLQDCIAAGDLNDVS